MKTNFITRTVVFISVLILFSLSNVYSQEWNNIDNVIYLNYKAHIANNLKSEIGNKPSFDYLKPKIELIINNHTKKILKEAWIKDKHNDRVLGVESKLKKSLSLADRQDFDKILTIGNFPSNEYAINNYLAELFSENEILRATPYPNPSSYYRVLIGGSWVHTKEELIEPKLNASLLFRTRLSGKDGDQNGYISELNLGKHEGRFLDLMVDAEFLSNRPFNVSVMDSISSNPDYILKAFASSQITSKLFYAFSYRFRDYGTIGPVIGYEISTQEGYDEIFRRFAWGFRFENRSKGVISGAAAEVKFTYKKIAGVPSEDDNWFGTERVMLDFELPMVNMHTNLNIGLFIHFHGEWQIKEDETEKNKYPSVYQFRLAATFDAPTLFGRLFGK
ncbi:MAG: hypothetical protein GY863_15685 [bacterium]|nr:hypothetical protein [bacterium]